ncbi:MAG: hypothetical protein JSV49_06085 [Thermoplasmata archaeon]|nr:MAG: hypothetical protein JSV49_06085 [Thermoplasmata archaeon]
MIESTQILKLLPNIDCGLCSNPSCATLARKISRNTQDAKDCPLVRKDNLKRINQLIGDSEPDQMKNQHDSNEYYDEEIVEIQPCAEYGRVTLEAHLPRPENSAFDLFDSCEMCLSFNNIQSLTNVKCSLEMGYGLAQSEERRIHVFKTGKIMIRRAKDRTDAVNTLKLISYSLGPSIICSCGNSLTDCLSGGCEECCTDIGYGLKWLYSSHEYTMTPAAELLRSRFESFKGKSPKQPEKNQLHIFKEAWDRLKSTINTLEELDKLIKANKFGEIETYRENLYDDIKEISKSSNEYLISDLEIKPPAEALLFLGICRNLRRIVDGFLSLKDSQNNEEVQKLYPAVSSIVIDGLRSFISCDEKQAAKVEDDFSEFSNKLRSELEAQNYPVEMVNLYKLAINGTYTARILNIKVPV